MQGSLGVCGVVLAATALWPMGIAAAAEADPGRVYPVADGIYVAVVEDRNTPFLVGENGVLLAETNFERNAAAVAAQIAGVTPEPVSLVVNSHWHPDHVGGNSYFANQGAITLAHTNTRLRMSEEQQNQTTGQVQSEAFVPGYLPILTFDDEMTIHWDDMEVDLVFYPDAHTDSDVVMYYRDANVIYIGGLLNYPTYAGVYRVPGFLAALDAVLAEADEATQIIPWRGPVIGRAEVAEWRDLLATVSERVAAEIADGKSMEEVLAAGLSAEFDAKWGAQRTPERFVQDIHAALTSGAN